MRVTVLCTLPTDHTSTRRWLPEALSVLGHDVELVDRPDLPAAQAATLGYRLADSWHGGAPDAVLAAGWVAGMAALVATRERPSPVLLRLPRVGRSGDAAVTRVERALVRCGATALAASPSEAEALAVLGAPRASTRVVPEATLSPSGEAEARRCRPTWWWRPTTPPKLWPPSSPGWLRGARQWSSTAACSRTSWSTGSPAWCSRR